MKRTNRFLSAILAICMMVGLLPMTALPVAAEGDTVPTTSWTDEGNYDTLWYTNDTSATTFTINTAAELAGLAKLVNSGTDNFSGDTINLDGNPDLGAHLWVPIGTNGYSLQGTFDGNGKIISNMTVDGDFAAAGLFGFIENTTIKNVNVTGSVTATLTSGVYAGGVVGRGDDSNIIACSFAGDVSGTAGATADVGGVDGYVAGTSTVNNCYHIGAVTATVTEGSAISGGVVGTADGNIKVSNSYHVGAVAASGRAANVGGVVGYHRGGTIQNCYYDSTVDTSAYTNPTGVIGKTTAELKALTDTLNSAQAYNVGDYMWAATGDSDNGGYPKLILAPSFKYIDASGVEQEVVATEITTTSTTLGIAGEETWYVVSADVTIGEEVAVNGNVNLILADGKTLTATAGITIADNATLTVYGQAGGSSGMLTVTAGNEAIKGSGTLNVYGGSVSANGNSGAVASGVTVYVGINMKYGWSDTSLDDVVYTVNSTGAAIATDSHKHLKIAQGNIDWADIGASAVNAENTGDYYTSDNTNYTIYTAKGLGWVAQQVNSGTDNFENKTITLNADIDLTTAGLAAYGSAIMADTATDTQKVLSWIPIGTSTNPFKGTFDGAGHTVSGVYINQPISDYIGLFGYNSGTVKNVGVVESCIIGRDRVGGVVARNSGTVENSYNAATITGDDYVGGVVGLNDGTVKNSYNTGNIIGIEDDDNLTGGIGGVVGQNNVTVENSYNTGDVKGTADVGGVIGDNLNGTVTDCYYDNSITITGTANTLGEAKPLAEMTAEDFVTILNGDPSSDAWFFKEASGSTSYYPGLVAFSGDADYTPPSYTPPSPGGGGGGGATTPDNTVDSEEPLTSDDFKELAESGDSLTVNGDNEIEAEFDTEALDAILGEADGKTVEFIAKEADTTDVNDAQKIVVGDNLVLDLRVLIDGVEFTDFLTGEVTISLPYELQEGETAENIKVYYVDEQGNKTLIESSFENGVLTFKTNHFSLYMVTYELMSFDDVAETDWYYDAVMYAVENGLFYGVSETEFSPNAAMSRAMMWTVLARMDGVDTEVSEGEMWYSIAQNWAIENEISDGTDPDGLITREQFVTMLYRYEQANGGGFVGTYAFPLDFPDAEKVSEWAWEATLYMTMRDVIGGMEDGTLAPQGEASRAQVATMLMRYLTME